MIKKSFKSSVSILLAIVIVLSTIIIPNVVNIKADADTNSELYMQDFEGVNPLSDYIKGSDLSSAEIVAEKNNPQNNVIKFDREGNDDTSIQSALYKIFEVKPNTNYVFTVDANVTDKKENASSLTMWQGCGLSVHGVTYSGDVPSFGKDFANPTNIKCDGNALTTYENNDGTGVVHFNIAETNNWNTYTLSFNSGENNYVAIAWHIIYSRAEVMLDNVSLERETVDFNYDFNNGSFPTSLTKGAKATQDGAVSFVDKGSNDKAVQLDFTTLGGATQVTFDYGFYKIIPVNPNTNYTYSFDAKITNKNEATTIINAYGGGAFFVGGASSATAASNQWTSLLENANNVCYDGVIWNSSESAIKNVPNGIVSPGWGGKIGFGAEAEDEWHNYSVSFNSGDNEYIVVANFIIYAGDVVLSLDNISFDETTSDFNYDFNNEAFPTGLTKGAKATQDGAVSFVDKGSNDKAVQLDFTTLGGATQVTFDYGFYKIIPVNPNTNYTYSFDAKITNKNEATTIINAYGGGAFFVGSAPSATAASSEWTSLLENANNVCYDGDIWNSSESAIKNVPNGIVSPGWGGKIGFGAEAEDEWHNYSVSFNSGDNEYIVVANFIIYAGDVVLGLDNISLKEKSYDFECDFESADSINEFTKGNNLNSANLVDINNLNTNKAVKISKSSGDSTSINSSLYRIFEVTPNTNYIFSIDTNVTDRLENADSLNMWQGCGISVRGVTYSESSQYIGKNFALETNVKYDDSSLTTYNNSDGDGVIHLETPKTNEWHTYTLSFNSGENSYVAIAWHIIYSRAVVMLDNVKLELDPIQPAPVGTIFNGDFETGNVLPFEKTGANTQIEIATTEGANGTDTYVGKITSSADFSDLYSNSVKSGNILIEKDKYYTLSFDLKLIDFSKNSDGSNKNFANGGVYLTAGDKMLDLSGWSDGNFAEMSGDKWWIISTNDNEWHKYELSFSSENNTELTFNYFNPFASTSAYIDNIVLTETEPPKPPVVGEVTNGDFEDGNVLPFASTGGNTKIEIAKTKGPDGTNTYVGKITSSADYTSLTSNSVKSGNILIEKNKYYTLSFDLKLINFAKNPDGTNKNWANGGVYLTAGDKMLDLSGWSDGNFAEMSGDNWWIISTNDNEWHKYEVSFSSGDNTEVVFNYFNLFASASAYIDNIVLTETEPPKPPVVGEVTNGDFETGSVEPFASTGGNTKIEIAKTKGPDGTNTYVGKITSSADYTSLTSNSVKSGNILIEKNKYYTLSFDLKLIKFAKNPDGTNKNWANGGVYLTAGDKMLDLSGWSDGNFAEMSGDNWWIISTNDNEWHKYEVSFSSGNNTEIVFNYFNLFASASAYIDNIKLTESKAPVVGEITNGDFENGNVLPFVSTGANTKIEIATTKGPDGTNTYVGKITSSADYSSLSSNSVKRDNILIEKNKYYTLSFDLKLINFAKNPDGTNKNWANGGVYLTAGDKMLDLSGWSDGNFAEMSGDNWWIISTNDNEWHKYKLTFYADNVTSIAFNYFNLFASASAYIDNIKIVETDASLIPSKDNLINGSFENTEDFYPYNLSDQIKVNITDIEHSDGKYSLKCEGNGTVSQTIDVEPYTYYEWFIDVKINKAAKGKFDIEKNNLSVACLGTFNGNGKPIWSTISGTKAYPQTFNDGYNQLLWTTDVWETYRVSFYTDEHTSIKLTYYNKQDTVAFIDNLRLVRGETVAKRDELTGTQIIFNNFDNEYASAYGIGLNKTDSAFISKTDSYSGNQCAVLQPSKLGEVNLIAYKDRYYSTQNVSIKNMEVGKVYRLSCYAKLNFDCDDYTMEFRLSPYNSEYQTYKHIVSQEWKKYELIFTPTQEEYGFNILNINYDNYLSASDALYIDDICLEVVENEIISTNVDNTYSFELTNAIKNGNFEYEFTDNDWLEMGDTIKRIENKKQAFIGNAYANINGNVNYEKVLNIKPGKVYTFAVSLRSNSENSNFKIGIVSEEGKPFALKDDKNVTSFFSAPALGDGWQRFAITLLPTNDKVKLVIIGDNIDIDIDALVFAIPEATTKTDKNIYDISTHDDTVLNAKIAGIAQEMSGWLWGIIGGVALLTSAIGIVVIIYFKKRRAKK